MKIFFTLMALLAVATSVFAQYEPITIPLYGAGEIPYAKASSETEEIQSTNIVVVRKVQEPIIQVFLPSKANATGQAVVICPGGGYGVLAYDWEGLDIAKWLNSHGIAGIVLKYRLPSAESQTEPHMVPLTDAKRALRLARSHAEEWNISPDKIGIMGFSAGGHLASTLATHFDAGDNQGSDPVEKLSSRPDFAILAYPVVSFDMSFTHSGSRNNLIGQNPDPKWVEYFSNEKQVSEETPPTFLFHAQDDATVPVRHSLAFLEALTAHKVPAELHVYPTGGHGFSLSINKEGTQKGWTDSCIKWLGELNKK
jgi:acetyl esterase/lipase